MFSLLKLQRLSLNLPELLELLVPLVLDRRVHGRIDCVSQELFLDDRFVFIQATHMLTLKLMLCLSSLGLSSKEIPTLSNRLSFTLLAIHKSFLQWVSIVKLPSVFCFSATLFTSNCVPSAYTLCFPLLISITNTINIIGLVFTYMLA